MIKLVKVPLQLELFLKEFQDLFTRPSYNSFCDMCSALSVCDKSKTVSHLSDTMAKDREGTKSRSSYNWFFSDAIWDENEVAQRSVDLFIEANGVSASDKILLIIDDTYNEKEGKCTDGVGKFYDHCQDSYIMGNNFVASAVQSKGIFIPHKAKMYIKKTDGDEDFRTKIEIAYRDIIEPLKLPKGLNPYIVFDSWWFSADFITKCMNLGYQIVCEIKSDKKVWINNDMSFQVRDMANQIDEKFYKRTSISVRGKKKVYYAIEKEVTLDKIGKAKLVISKKKKNGDANYFISTNCSLSLVEILSIYMDRWNIETAHREANQKLGFKDYQLRGKQSIERFIQMVFSVWTALVLYELQNPPVERNQRTIGDMVDSIKAQAFIDAFIYVLKYFNFPVPDSGLLYLIKEQGYKI
jgi:SRSO17 transposase